MVMTALRSEIALTRDSTLVPRDRMVQVAFGRRPSATRRGALGVPGLDQVLEVAAGPVSRFRVFVAALAAGDWSHPHTQVAQPVLGLSLIHI